MTYVPWLRESQPDTPELLRTTNTPITDVIIPRLLFLLQIHSLSSGIWRNILFGSSEKTVTRASKFTAAINKQVDNWEGKRGKVVCNASAGTVALGHANVLARH
jgi:hypothetical protein